MPGVCKACARPLKEKSVIKSGKPVKVWVCKSPICKRYNK
jgi:hypothetical protein